MQNILEVQDLVKHYRQVCAVDGISFSLAEGMCFGLLGPNGAGKTTTIEIMEGILKPDRGQILYRGRPIDSEFKKRAGIQFQNTSLPDHLTVSETIRLFQSFYPEPRPFNEIVEICSLSDILSRDNKKLSGGQRQRLLLAIAIVPQPDLVFLDEPTTGLDPQARRNFWDLIRRIQTEGATIVLTTHYMDEAHMLCDQIGIMDHGKMLEIDAPQAMLDRHFEGVLVRIPFDEPKRIDFPLPEGTVVRNDAIELTSTRLDETVRRLITLGLSLDGLSVHKPTLEDLFIKLTGNTLRA
ncbi:MAG: ABC transporter ATP-binding protein [Spirochaetaceae bacterium]|nr:MAG: ABC transporter ATP-binding protein [Spirochaetaceae bacterium]